MARPKGSINKRSDATRRAVINTGITPLDYLLSVMRDTKQPEPTRIDAAKAAAPYVHAKLASIEHSGKGGGAIVVQMTGVDEAL